MEVSAKTNKNIQEAFMETLKHIPQEMESTPSSPKNILLGSSTVYIVQIFE